MDLNIVNSLWGRSISSYQFINTNSNVLVKLQINCKFNPEANCLSQAPSLSLKKLEAWKVTAGLI